ncbi:unnamed protein product [Nesidiocoris tenuis]|uniref:Ig-like domain-containing protein n=1 Tax=Nesidiocoris tenuis TaxID=355587 RepID=A0A6H5GDV8_9HEMI|nr:unnamed protein product [Nesidiocoris tenuis]
MLDTYNIRDPPKIVERPRNQMVRAGVIAAFFCEAKGDPLPTIAWRKNGKKVSSTQSRYLVQEYAGGSSMLRIEPVRSVRDDATYECVAENGVGDAVSAEAVLTVFENTRQNNFCLYSSVTRVSMLLKNCRICVKDPFSFSRTGSKQDKKLPFLSEEEKY